MALSFISRGFKSFYNSGTFFSEQIAPKWLGKSGRVAGGILGIASVATGACFLAAIPISLPMFLVATGIFASKGMAAVVFVTGFLGSVGTVMTTTGLGMTRALVKDTMSLFKRVMPAKTAAASPPEKTSFNRGASAKRDFKKAAKAEALPAPQQRAAIPAPAPA